MSDGVSGCIARVEPTAYYRRFIDRVRPEWAMIKLHHAGHLVERGETAATWAPETKLITTSTISDEQLDEISWSEERNILREFRPAKHIPADVSVYRDQRTSDRVEAIKNCMVGAAYIQSELAAYETEIIPLFKGYTNSERELSLQAAGDLGADTVAIYASRYFSGNQGNKRKQLFRDLRKYSRHNIKSALLIGLLSPKYLAKVPGYITAAAGQNQWRKRYSPDSQTIEESRASYQSLTASVETALGLSSQAPAADCQPEEKAIGD